jgi:hypothetical protein
MSSLANYVALSISLTAASVPRAGFGVPLIVSYSATWPERTRTYTNFADAIVDFPTTTSPEYKQLQAIFSQSPCPARVIVGRGALPPTLVYQLSAISPTGLASYKYQVKVKGQGFADTTVEFTSDANPTDAEYAAGMVSALNAVSSKNYTAAGSSSPITITANAAGNWFSIEVVDVNTQKVLMTHVDPGIATDLAAITAENGGWYGLCHAYPSNALGLAAAAWVEANKRIFICDSNDTNTIITTVGNGDLIDDLKTNAYANTLGFYHPNPAAFAGAALLGKCLPKEPGSETWAFKSLVGPAVVALTGTHRTNLVARNGNSYESPTTGVSITFNGKTGDGGFLDTKRGLHWLEDDLSKEVLGTFVASDKVPFTDPGIGMVEAGIRRSLRRATDRGILAADPEFAVTVPLAADVSSTDKALRALTGIRFTGVLAGAVHSTSIIGSITA